MESGDARLVAWEERLEELEARYDAIDRLLAEVEAQANFAAPGFEYDPKQLELFEGGAVDAERHQVRSRDGHVFHGTWHEIVRQMRDRAGFSHETLSHYMRRMAERWHERSGADIPFTDPESFLRAAVDVGLVFLEDEELE